MQVFVWHVSQGQLQRDPRVLGQVQPPAGVPRPGTVPAFGRHRLHSGPLRHSLGSHHVLTRFPPTQHFPLVGQGEEHITIKPGFFFERLDQNLTKQEKNDVF